MRKRWSWFAVSVLLATPCAQAATVLERKVSIDLRPDGSVVERERLRVRLDADRDLESWSPYVIYLDVNRELDSVTASVTRPDGRTESVARRAQDTHEVVAPGEVHSSRKLRSLTFPVAPAGSEESARNASACAEALRSSACASSKTLRLCSWSMSAGVSA